MAIAADTWRVLALLREGVGEEAERAHRECQAKKPPLGASDRGYEAEHDCQERSS